MDADFDADAEFTPGGAPASTGEVQVSCCGLEGGALRDVSSVVQLTRCFVKFVLCARLSVLCLSALKCVPSPKAERCVSVMQGVDMRTLQLDDEDKAAGGIALAAAPASSQGPAFAEHVALHYMPIDRRDERIKVCLRHLGTCTQVAALAHARVVSLCVMLCGAARCRAESLDYKRLLRRARCSKMGIVSMVTRCNCARIMLHQRDRGNCIG